MRKRNELTAEYARQLDELIEMRNKLKLSYGKLAEILNYNKFHLNEIFNKNRIVTVEKLKQFKRELDYFEFLENDKNSRFQNDYETHNYLIFDYVRVKFEGLSANQVLFEILELSDSRHHEVIDYGLYGYSKTFKFGGRNNIIICFNENRDNPNCILQISGQGCRELEDLCCWKNYSDWLNFYVNSHKFGGIFKRVDVAYNDCIDILDINSLIYDIDGGRYNSKFSIFRKLKSQKSGINASTLYCGGNRSDIQFCIYEKAKEQYFKGKIGLINDYEIINRFEIRYKNNRADWFVDQLLFGFSVSDIFYETINHYIDFPKNRGWKKFIKETKNQIDFKLKPKNFDYENLLCQIKKQYGKTLRTIFNRDRESYFEILNCNESKKLKLYFEKSQNERRDNDESL